MANKTTKFQGMTMVESARTSQTPPLMAGCLKGKRQGLGPLLYASEETQALMPGSPCKAEKIKATPVTTTVIAVKKPPGASLVLLAALAILTSPSSALASPSTADAAASQGKAGSALPVKETAKAPLSALAQKPEENTNTPLKVGFLCVGPATDWGFNYAHNQGRLYLVKSSEGKVQTTMAEKVPESAEAERVLEKLVASGHKLIFTTSYGYLEPAMRVAKRHPDCTFMQINRFKTAKNIGTYFSQQYQPMYLAGMAAGRMTKSHKLGFIAAHPVPPLLQAINAFTMGARSVDPQARTRVIFINSWSDAPLEAESVKGLKEAGCDVIAHAQDNQNTILKACEKQNIYSVGFYTDARALAPSGWLTGACLDWGPFYARIAQDVATQKWRPKIYAEGLTEKGYVKLASFGDVVPAGVRAEIAAKRKAIERGDFVIFAGPLRDRDDRERVAKGERPDIKQLSEMNWFVKGVQGALPSR